MKAVKFLKSKLKNPLIRLFILSTIYTSWVLWMGTLVLLFGLIILFDICLTKFINWRFWRKRFPFGGKQGLFVEFLDALIWAGIFAVIVRLFFVEAYTIPTSSMEKSLLVGDYIFVSKTHYGPRMPITPVTIPFTHNVLPFTKNSRSFLPYWQLPYKRLNGFTTIENFDVVVFNYPEGDTVIEDMPEKSYYTLARQYGSNYLHKNYNLIYRPVDKRDNYVKRVIGIPGDSVKIEHGRVFINNLPEVTIPGRQFNYNVKAEMGDSIYLKQLGVASYDIEANEYNSIYTFPLTKPMYRQLLNDNYFKAITRYENLDHTQANQHIFPFDDRFTWTEDNFGPIYIPEKHQTVELTIENLPLYERLITVYEKNILRLEGDSIYINDALCNTYRFEMNYYFMLGDNRHNSNDSRHWGFVPENHIIGRAKRVWFSIDRNKPRFKRIRWNKMFKFIR